MTISLGYQIPKFTYPGGAEALFGTVVAQAREAEASGFDTVLVMDHFYQLPDLGALDEPMLEAYSVLSALASSTSAVQLAALVTGNTYRNPALLAKTVTTLDVISRGRAILGIGAGWFQREHDDLGFPFGTFTERFAKLEEALQIITPMLRGERPSFTGDWYLVREAVNVPRYRESLPVMLGGAGEKKTFRLAARFADHLNIICPRDLLPGKVRVLAQRCEEIGRDPATLKTSFLATAIPVDGPGEAADVRRAISPFLRAEAFIGTPDEIAAQLAEQVIGAGIEGIIINMPVNGHEPGRIAAMGKSLRPLVSGVK